MNLDDENWRRLAEQIGIEADPMRLSTLLQKLIQALDARRQALQEAGVKPSSASDLSAGTTKFPPSH